MREEMNNDNAQLDRLVDGELSADERAEFLRSLDERPDGWRRCALAFLEAQAWRGEFRQLVREPEAAIEAHVIPATRPGIGRRNIRIALSWAGIAASLLVAFSLGFLQRGSDQSVNNAPIADVTIDPSNQIAEGDPAPRPELANPDVLTLWARDESGRPRSIRVPLMDAGALDRQLGVEFLPGMPAHVRSRLHDDGYDVQSKRRYAPLWLENGQRMVLPVEDTKIVPVSQNVY
jgi:hypothetical protein